MHARRHRDVIEPIPNPATVPKDALTENRRRSVVHPALPHAVPDAVISCVKPVFTIPIAVTPRGNTRRSMLQSNVSTPFPPAYQPKPMRRDPFADRSRRQVHDRGRELQPPTEIDGYERTPLLLPTVLTTEVANDDPRAIGSPPESLQERRAETCVDGR